MYEQIKERAKEMNLTQEEISFEVGRHNANFWNSIKENRVKLKDLLKVCEILNLKLTLEKQKK